MTAVAGDPSAAIAAIDSLGPWSSWVPFADAILTAPRDPGVYMARDGVSGPVVYVGMAGERRGQGIRGRLSAYASGKGLASGLGEALLDRALADPAWLRDRLTEASEGRPMRAKEWGRAAFTRNDLRFRWLACADKDEALAAEEKCIRLLEGTRLWNRRA